MAADYDPPIYVDQAPDYVPVEVGSGWYLRGDVGYAFSHPFEHQETATGQLDSFTDESSLFTGSIGMGYHFNDYLRVELNGGILPTNKFGDHARLAATCDGTTHRRSDGCRQHQFHRGCTAVRSLRQCVPTRATASWPTAMSTSAPMSGFTPYVGGGLGLAYNKYFKTHRRARLRRSRSNSSRRRRVLLRRSGWIRGSDDSEAQFNLAYSIGAGLSYQVTKNVSVDLGYEYFSVPSAKYVAYDGGAFNIHKGIDYQTVKLGLRYDLW